MKGGLHGSGAGDIGDHGEQWVVRAESAGEKLQAQEGKVGVNMLDGGFCGDMVCRGLLVCSNGDSESRILDGPDL